MVVTLIFVAVGGAIAQCVFSILSYLRRISGTKPIPGPKGMHRIGVSKVKAQSYRRTHTGQHLRYAQKP